MTLIILNYEPNNFLLINLNTNLTSCNMPQNYVDTTQEDIFLELMKIHWIIKLNILNNLRIHEFTHVCVVIDYALENKW
jgi:hypothetical protein